MHPSRKSYQVEQHDVNDSVNDSYSRPLQLAMLCYTVCASVLRIHCLSMSFILVSHVYCYPYFTFKAPTERQDLYNHHFLLTLAAFLTSVQSKNIFAYVFPTQHSIVAVSQ